MLDLGSNEWKNLQGGYKLIYDASVPLKQLETLIQPNEEIWNELWEELYHQGDVGIASYAVIPQICRIYREKQWIDFNLPNFIAAVERARFEEHNPKLPKWLEQDYFKSLQEAIYYCIDKAKNNSNKELSRAVLLLTAILLKEFSAYEILEAVEIGEEEKLLEFYFDRF